MPKLWTFHARMVCKRRKQILRPSIPGYSSYIQQDVPRQCDTRIPPSTPHLENARIQLLEWQPGFGGKEKLAVRGMV